MRLATLGVSAVLALLALASPSPAAAHALLVSSDPAVGASLARAPTSVTITFTEKPDPKLSTIKVLDSNGDSVTSGPTAAVPGRPNELTVPLASLPPGVYTVAWRTLSTVDGHLAAGSFAFGVGVAPPPPTGSASGSVQPSSGSSTIPPLAVVGRWLLYVGLMAALGTSFIGAVIYRRPPPRTTLIATLSWLAIAIGTVLVVGVQVSYSGVDLVTALGTSIGTSALIRAVPLLMGLLTVAVTVGRRVAFGRRGQVLQGLAAAGCMLSDALTSHAAAGSLVALQVAIQWLHIGAAGVWLGGLLVLLVTLPGIPGEESGRAARRFAVSATAGIVIVGATGFLRAIAEVGSIDALVTTGFGLVVLAKSGLLVALAGLGAVNHFRHVPMAHRSVRGLRGFGTTELAIGAVALVLSSTLVNLAPPVQQTGSSGATAVQPLVANGNDFATTLRARLEVSPGTAGFNTFQLALTDYDTGQPLTDRTVDLRFALPSRPDIGTSQLDLPMTAPGVYSATGANLSIDGSWRVTAQIGGGDRAVEVALSVSTRTAQPSIDINKVPGLPTIYTVHLPGNNSVQVYLDPGTPGANELHVTFFDPAGNELPVPSVQLGIAPSGQPPAALTPRELEPGHFVADTQLKAGSYRVSIAGTPPGGQPLTTELTVTVAQ